MQKLNYFLCHGNLNDGSMPLNDFVALIKKAIEEELEN